MKCLNIGCGSDYRASGNGEEWVNIDKNPNLKADIYTDLEDAVIALPTSSVDHILAKHVLEHITNLIPLMDELWRVLKPDGILEVYTPYWTNKWAWGDPTHVRAFFEGSFVFWDKAEVRKQVAEGRPTSQLGCKADFKVLEVKPILEPGMKEKFKTEEELRSAILYYNNVVAELRFKLEAVKNGKTKE